MSAFVPDSIARAEEAERDKHELPSAADRLAASRERMREWMQRTDGRYEARRRAEAATAAGERPAWMDRLRTAPVIGVVIDAASAWWTNHPLNPAATLAHGVVRDTVAPMARRHPIAIVAGAFVAGLLVVRLRPWRWLVKPALFAGLTTQIITRVVSSVPMEAVFEALGSFAQRRRRAAAEDATPTAPTDADAEAPRMASPLSATASEASIAAETVTP